MAFDYARAQKTAERLIANFGTSAVLYKRASTGDAWAPTVAETAHDCIAVALQYSLAERAGTLVEEGARRILISTNALEVTPVTDDRLTFDGVTYSLISVDPMSPAETVVYWDVQARA